MASFTSSPSPDAEAEAGSVFEFGGKREMVDRARALELLATVAHVADPAAIRLSNKSFGIDAAEAIAERLSTFKNLRVADISDIIAGRPEEEALRVLRTVCAALAACDLIEVNVSDNAFGLKGVDACRNILVGKNTEKFYFCNNGLSAEAVHGIADLFSANPVSAEGGEGSASTSTVPPVRVLHFYNNMCGNGGAVGMARIVRSLSGTLRDLRFSATRSSGEGCTALAQALLTLTQLERLDLMDTHFGEAGGRVLARAIAQQPNLTFLNLRDAGIEGRAASDLLSALPAACKGLRFLDLSGNDFEADICDALGRCVQGLPHLEELHLDDNDIESEGAAAVAKYLRAATAPSLRLLSMCTCSITAYGAIKVARAVSKLPAFEILKIDGNAIFEESVGTIEDLLTSKGKKLAEMEDNDEDGDDDAGSAAESESEEDDAGEGEEEGEEEGVDATDASVADLSEALGKTAI